MQRILVKRNRNKYIDLSIRLCGILTVHDFDMGNVGIIWGILINIITLCLFVFVAYMFFACFAGINTSEINVIYFKLFIEYFPVEKETYHAREHQFIKTQVSENWFLYDPCKRCAIVKRKDTF